MHAKAQNMGVQTLVFKLGVQTCMFRLCALQAVQASPAVELRGQSLDFQYLLKVLRALCCADNELREQRRLMEAVRGILTSSVQSELGPEQQAFLQDQRSWEPPAPSAGTVTPKLCTSCHNRHEKICHLCHDQLFAFEHGQLTLCVAKQRLAIGSSSLGDAIKGA